MDPLQFRMCDIGCSIPLSLECWLQTLSITSPLANSCVECLHSMRGIWFLLLALSVPLQSTVHQSILFYNFDVDKYHFSPAPQKAHLPDLETFDGLKDVMALCSVIELGSAMSPWSYQLMVTNQRERERMIFAHRRSRRLVTWIFYLFEVLDQDGKIIAEGEQDLYWPYVEKQARVLCHYKSRTWEEGILGSNMIECKPADLKKIFSCFSHDLNVLSHFYGQFDEDEKTFAWVGHTYRMRRRLESELTKIAPPPGTYSIHAIMQCS